MAMAPASAGTFTALAAVKEPAGPLAELAAKVRAADMEALRTLYGTLSSWPDAWLREAARDVIFQRMAELDAPAALRWARTNPGGDKKAFVYLLRAWAEADPDGAVDAAFAAGSSVSQARENASIVLAHLAVVKPEAFFARVKEDPSAVSHDVFTKAMQTMARHDPAAARLEYESLPEKVKSGMTGPFAEGWARKDLQGALTWAKQLPEPARQGAIFGIIAEIGPGNPQTALREAAAYLEKDGESKEAPVWVVKAIARGLAREQPEKALEWVRAHSSGADQRKIIGWEVLPWIASGDGPDAGTRIVRALGQMDDETLKGGLKNFLSTWQPADPAAQLLALAGLPPADSRWEVMSAAAELWALREPTAALKEARETQDESLRYYISGALGNHFCDTRNAEGFMQVMPLLNPKFKAGFCGTFAKLLAWETPERGVQFTGQLAEGSPERHAAIESMAPFYGSQDPAAALAWAESLKDDERTLGLGHVFKSWGNEDPLAVSRYVQALPPGQTRDVGAGMLALNLAQTEPDSAFAWMQSVNHAETRETLYGLILRSWTRLDAVAARQSIEDARIPEPAKEKLRAHFDVFSLQPK
jgi:hypothetical protein